MTPTRFEVFSVSPFTATFRTVRSERVARLLTRLYNRVGFVDHYGTRLSFDYTAVCCDVAMTHDYGQVFCGNCGTMAAHKVAK